MCAVTTVGAFLLVTAFGLGDAGVRGAPIVLGAAAVVGLSVAGSLTVDVWRRA